MLDEKDLKAIKEIIDSAVERGVDKAVDRAVEQSTRYMNIIVENRVEPQLKILAEGHQLLLEQLEPLTQDVEMLKREI